MHSLPAFASRLLRQAKRDMLKHGVKLLFSYLGSRSFVLGRQAVFLTPRAVHYDRCHDRSQPPGASFQADIFHSHDGTAPRTGRPGARHRAGTDALVVFPSLRRIAAALGHVRLHAKCHTRSERRRAPSSAEPACDPFCTAIARLEQRQHGAALLTGHGPRV